MDFPEPEKRTCKVCGMEAYKVVEFNLRSYPNTCKKCVAKKQRDYKEKFYGKKEGWNWKNQKFCPPRGS